MLTPADLDTLLLTFKVASISTALMLLLGTPLAWWLARTRSAWKGLINAVVALPLVLPPTVLGFYLLVLMGPAGVIGRIDQLVRHRDVAVYLCRLGGGFGAVFHAICCAAFASGLHHHRRTAFGSGGNLARQPSRYVFQRGRAIGETRFFDRYHFRLYPYCRRIRRGADGGRQHSRQNPRRVGANLQSCRSPGI